MSVITIARLMRSPVRVQGTPRQRAKFAQPDDVGSRKVWWGLTPQVGHRVMQVDLPDAANRSRILKVCSIALQTV